MIALWMYNFGLSLSSHDRVGGLGSLLAAASKVSGSMLRRQLLFPTPSLSQGIPLRGNQGVRRVQ